MHCYGVGMHVHVCVCVGGGGGGGGYGRCLRNTESLLSVCRQKFACRQHKIMTYNISIHNMLLSHSYTPATYSGQHYQIITYTHI